MISTLALVIASAPFAVVDVEAAVLVSAEGRRMKAELDAMSAAAQAEINRDRTALLGARSKLDAAVFAQKVEAFNARIDQMEAELEAKEDAKLAPVLSALEAQVEALASRGIRVILSRRSNFLGLPRVCDATRAVADDKAAVFVPGRACHERQVVRVAVGGALSGSPQASAATRALDQLQAEQQATLDAMRSELERATGAERRQLQADIEARYRAFSAQLERRGAKVEAELRKELVDALEAVRPSSLVILLADQGEVCDATSAAAELMQGGAFLPALERVCPRNDQSSRVEDP